MKNQNKLRVRKVKSVTSPVIKGMLKAGLAAGLVGTVVVAPNSLQAIDFVANQIDKQKSRSKRFKEYAKRSGYFEVESVGDNKYCIRLTGKGVKAAQDVIFQDYELARKEKWDGRWHILMFDIPERHKGFRDTLSAKASTLGMKLVQNSVYVYPYDISEFVQSLHAVHPEATQYVLHAEVVSISGEEQLIESFRKDRIL